MKTPPPNLIDDTLKEVKELAYAMSEDGRRRSRERLRSALAKESHTFYDTNGQPIPPSGKTENVPSYWTRDNTGDGVIIGENGAPLIQNGRYTGR